MAYSKQNLTTENIFEMCTLADDVLCEIRTNAFLYDKVTLKRKSPADCSLTAENLAFMKMTMAEGMDIQQVDALSLCEIKANYLIDYLPLALKLFRGEFPYPCEISEQVSDDYLTELFCVCFRDLLRIIVLRDANR